MDFKKIYIDGKWITPNSNDLIEVENPATRNIINSVPRSNDIDINLAVEAAKNAFPLWRKTQLNERIYYMEKFIHQLNKKINIMTETVVQELGSPYEFTKNKHLINYIDDIDNYIEIVKEYLFEINFEGYKVRKEPVGVVGALTPWNYPFGQIIKKVVPALLAGNTLVLKPSQETPLVAYHLADAIHSAGFPAGVFNMVPGKGKEVGNVLATHKDVDLISFTGSTSGGIEVGKLALKGVKSITLELGGKSPAIVLKDANLDIMYDVLYQSLFMNTGQSCSALSRLIAPRTMKNQLEEFLIKKVGNIKVGNPMDKNIDLGPLSSKKQFMKVKEYIMIGLNEGANMILGDIPDSYENGYYIKPVIFTDVDNDMKIAQEEIFGPVLSIIYYDSINDAISIANDSKFGLSSAIFGSDLEAQKIAKKLKTGNVIINDGQRTSSAPFGGYKESGIGREGGIYGLEEYLETKTIYL